MRIAILDTYYHDFLNGWKFDLSSTYDAELERLLAFSFGTADFYSSNLKALGHEAQDFIVNAAPLQKLWASENGFSGASLHAIALQQIETYRPDVVFCQDLSFFHESTLQHLGLKYVLSGHCSCPFPKEEKVIKFRILFSSFPHYIPRFRSLGVKPVYLPLAADVASIEARTLAVERDIDVSFVGGMGAPSHWLKGMDTLESIAQEIPQSKFWGYGAELLHPSSPIRAKHQGPALGVDMYQILRRSNVVLNRHGEVACGWANNMRLFEATGCGAALLTEDAPNLGSLFPNGGPVRYRNAKEAVARIKHLLADEDCRKDHAQRGYLETLSRHTYRERMAVLAAELEAV